jgi:RimJ/RimL family protein N-acetyltransferase
MLNYAFTVLGLHNVMLRVHAYNLAGLRTYQKGGYREFGRWREAVWMDGRRWDVVYVSRRRILRVYLLDAAAQLAIMGAWLRARSSD